MSLHCPRCGQFANDLHHCPKERYPQEIEEPKPSAPGREFWITLGLSVACLGAFGLLLWVLFK